MKLIIDNREPKELTSALQSRVDNVSLENLELGDIIIKNDSNYKQNRSIERYNN